MYSVIQFWRDFPQRTRLLLSPRPNISTRSTSECRLGRRPPSTITKTGRCSKGLCRPVVKQCETVDSRTTLSSHWPHRCHGHKSWQSSLLLAVPVGTTVIFLTVFFFHLKHFIESVTVRRRRRATCVWLFTYVVRGRGVQPCSSAAHGHGSWVLFIPLQPTDHHGSSSYWIASRRSIAIAMRLNPRYDRRKRPLFFL